MALVEFDPDSYTVNEEDQKVEFRIVKQSETLENITVFFSTDVSVLDPATSMNPSVCCVFINSHTDAIASTFVSCFAGTHTYSCFCYKALPTSIHC